MFKNVAGQFIELFAYNTSTGAPATGDGANLAVHTSRDGGTLSALTDTSATEISSTNAPGWYRWDVTQAESNGDAIFFGGRSTTSSVVLVGQRILTRPPNFTALSINSGGRALIQSGLQRNASAVVSFPMRDTTGAPLTGSTVTVSFSHDAGTSFTTIGSATEKANGFYHISLNASQMNAPTVLLRFTGSGGSGAPADNGMLLFTDP